MEGIMRPERPGYLLDGGGFLGARSVGCLCGLEDFGIPPAVYMGGTSAGALNAAEMTANDGKNALLLKNKWLKVESNGPEAIFPKSKYRMFQHRHASHLFPNDGIKALIESLDCRSIVRSPVHLDIMTTRERTRSRWIFTNRDELFLNDPELLKQAVLASTAIPGFLPAVKIGDEFYSDGLRIYIQRALQFDCDVLFIFLNTARRPPKNTFPENDHFSRRFLRISMGDQLVIEELQRLRHKTEPRIVVLRAPQWIGTLNQIDFRKGTKRQKGDISLAMDQSYDYTIKKLEKIFTREI